MDLRKALKSLDLKDLWERDSYVREILEDFDLWLDDEEYVQDWIESNLRSDDEVGE